MAATAESPLVKIVALCGSLRHTSFNRGLIKSAIESVKELAIPGLQIELVEINSLPFINTDLEVDGKYPPAVETFRQKIHEADGFLFASPEYNYSVSPILKNAIDWASRPPNAWATKSAAMISASESLGGARAQYHLRQIGVILDLYFINRPEFFLNAYVPPAKFDKDGSLIDENAKEAIKAVIQALHTLTLKLKVKSMSSSSSSAPMHPEHMFCYCGYPAKESTTHTASNHGQRLSGCCMYEVEDKHYNFFSWNHESFDPSTKCERNKVVNENDQQKSKMKKLKDSNRRLKLERRILILMFIFVSLLFAYGRTSEC